LCQISETAEKREVSEKKICTVNDQLNDLETQIDKITESIESLSDSKSHKINALVQLLGIHSKALDALTQDAQSFKTSLHK
jgi:DNA integrity scanning protein DisA with diadenylate cyclase activity